MGRRASWVGLFLTSIAASVSAQTLTGSGTTNTVPVFTGTSTIGNSPISVSGIDVGIGTTSPSYGLDVNGTVRIVGTLRFGNLTDPSYIAPTWNDNLNTGLAFHSFSGGTDTTAMTIAPAGNVGISGRLALGNLANPSYIAPIWNDNINTGLAFHTFSNGVDTTAISISPTGGLLIGNVTDPSYIAPIWNDDVNTGLAFHSFLGNTDTTAMTVIPNGSVGIGTTNPQAKLEINGNLRFTADGSVQTTAWTGVLCGGDYAEAVNAAGDKKAYEPGDVLVLASDTNGNVEKSHEPYSTMVAGIYATKPGVIGRRQSLVKDADELPMAMVGIVPTKVTAENGPIKQGDLLVTSSQMGLAMKGTERSRMLGAVIGKAMGSLESGSGLIEVLVTLQ